jgi:hypothetical protein
MKENILKILDAILKNEYFFNSEISLTVNYDNVFQYIPIINNNENIPLIYNKLNKFINIKNFNITVKIDRGINKKTFQYDYNWKSNSFIFYGGEDKYELTKYDFLKYAFFDFHSFGDRESLRLHEKLQKKDAFSTIYGNLFEYDKVNDIIIYLIELDRLLDKQFEEKQQIYNILENYKYI